VTTPALTHAQVAAGFTDRVRGVAPDGWDAPAPVDGWSARDVVRHLIEWSASFLHGGTGVRLASGPSVDDDPVGAWAAHRDAVQELLEDTGTPARVLSNPHVGEVPLDTAVDRFYTPDVFLHTWDLARATGQDERLDPERCRALYEGMLPMDEVLRASGQYGPRVPVPEDADIQTKLLGFIGRRV
jgi:uncharacterized protein (TIGR03086 family)